MAYELVYIGATWCGTCKTIKPQLEELCRKFSVSMKTLDYDVDLETEDQELITKVPTVRICENNSIIATFNVNQVASAENWFKLNIKLAQSDDF